MLLVALQLQRGGDLAGAPGGQQAGSDAGADRQRERHAQHGQIQAREGGVIGRLLAHLDLPMLLATFVFAVVASLLAGLLPAWRACLIPPALQLKSN